MAAARTIICEDCGTPYETSRPNTRVCAVCRMVADIRFTGERTKECWLCDKEFIPLARGETACGDCTYEVRGHGKVECAFCHAERYRVKSDVAVCNSCARDPKHRRLFYKSLIQKQATRRESAAVAA